MQRIGRRTRLKPWAIGEYRDWHLKVWPELLALNVGAGIRNYVTSLLVTNSHASVGTLVEIKDGTTVIWRGYAPPGGGYAVHFPVPLRGTANTAINTANITTASNTYVSAAGFKGP